MTGSGVRVALLGAALLLLAAGPQTPPRPAWYLGLPDAGAGIQRLDFQRLDGSIPLYYAAEETMRPDAREEQIGLLEARAFWDHLLGAAPTGGLLLCGSDRWVALEPDLWHGFPGARVRTDRDGVLALMAVEDSTLFGELAGQVAGLAPLEWRGRLVGYDLASPAGAARYARAWRWVLLGEGLTEGLRIGAQSWWQRRIVGAVAAWQLLGSSRGGELAPGDAEALDVWSWFFTGYLGPIAIPLGSAGRLPPGGDPRLRLELDARLLRFGRLLFDTFGQDTYRRLREAWPSDASFETVPEAAEALRARIGGLEDALDHLLVPIPPDIRPRPPSTGD